MPTVNTKEGAVIFNYGIITKGLINRKIELLSFYSKEAKRKVFNIFLAPFGNDNYIFVEIFSDSNKKYKLKANITNWLTDEKYEIRFSWFNGNSKKYRLYINGILKDEIQTQIDLRDAELTVKRLRPE